MYAYLLLPVSGQSCQLKPEKSIKLVSVLIPACLNWYIYWDALGTIILWAWNIMRIWMMHRYLTYWDKLVLKLILTWLNFLVLVGKIFQTLAELNEHTLSFIKVVQFTMVHMFQDQILNQVHKVRTMQHALHEWLWHISGC